MKLLVVSIDALFSADLEYCSQYPALSELLKHSITVKDMQAVYPALTYPCHASILSGNYPAVHGVYHNLECVPNAHYSDWKWYYQEVKCPTLFNYCHRAGWKTSSVFWPVTANAPVDYLVPEIWSYTGDPVEVIKSTSDGATNAIIEKYRELVDFTSKYKLDLFAKNCAAEIISQYHPDAMFLHFSLVDNTRHGYGTRHPKVVAAIQQCYEWLEEILQLCLTEQGNEAFTLVVLGDHGHLDCHSKLSVNQLFAQKGWLELGTAKALSDCPVFCHAAGVSAQVYLQDKTLQPQVEELFKQLVCDGYLLGWYPTPAVREWGLDGPFDYVLEAADGYFFVGAITQSFVTLVSAKEGKGPIGKHGHCPLRGEKPPFVLCHPSLPNAAVTQGKNIVDIAPTLCKFLTLPSDRMQGSSIL